MALDGHEFECARAAIAARIERAKTASERQQWAQYLREIECKQVESSHE